MPTSLGSHKEKFIRTIIDTYEAALLGRKDYTTAILQKIMVNKKKIIKKVNTKKLCKNKPVC